MEPEKTPTPPINRIVETVKDNALFLLGIVAIFWAIEILDFILPFISLDTLGIRPRFLPGLIGLVTAPFLHLTFGHLLSNTVPFLVLGGVVLLGGRKTFVTVSIFIALIGGFALWLLGPGGTNHIGASLVIFGYLGFLLARGVFEKSGPWIAVSLITLVLYGGMIIGVLPSRPEISWQGHLFGFIAGILSARLMFAKDSHLY